MLYAALDASRENRPAKTVLQVIVWPELSKHRATKSKLLQCDEQLATSRLLFLAEFLEGGVAAQRVPEWIYATPTGRRLFFSWTYQNRPLIVASDSS